MKPETLEIFFKCVNVPYTAFIHGTSKKIDPITAIKHRKSFDVKFYDWRHELLYDETIKNEYVCRHRGYGNSIGFLKTNVEQLIESLFNEYLEYGYQSIDSLDTYIKECNKLGLLGKSFDLFNGDHIRRNIAIENEISFMLLYTHQTTRDAEFVVFDENGINISNTIPHTTKYSREKFDIYNLMRKI